MVELSPIRRDAPWAWLKAGWQDLKRAPLVSIGYGLVFALIGTMIVAGLAAIHMASAAPVALAGFALIAPVFAIGVYRISEMIDAGETPRLLDFWRISGSRLSQLALLSVLLLIFFLTWARMAQFLYVALAPAEIMSLSDFFAFAINSPKGLALMGFGTLIGFGLAVVAFSVSAISFPMLVDQDVDAITALVASVKAVIKNPFVMLTWAWLIAFMTIVGIAFFLVGLAVTFPWIAHASWRAYKDFAPRPEPSASAIKA
ncbi:DUF2189 domain-containing protein [Woodsholea maritima]|uniref:DUF2189 domain-containing protein n=1 Tax=Woodsholea maritima TaxID=240237 RepID=UPI0003784261|nr:DUF2189 domain-containing protein [Woodsholea maritima]